MKEWTAPMILDMDVSDTKHGGTLTKNFDNVYVDGPNQNEATYAES